MARGCVAARRVPIVTATRDPPLCSALRLPDILRSYLATRCGAKLRTTIFCVPDLRPAALAATGTDYRATPEVRVPRRLEGLVRRHHIHVDAVALPEVAAWYSAAKSPGGVDVSTLLVCDTSGCGFGVPQGIAHRLSVAGFREGGVARRVMSKGRTPRTRQSRASAV